MGFTLFFSCPPNVMLAPCFARIVMWVIALHLSPPHFLQLVVRGKGGSVACEKRILQPVLLRLSNFMELVSLPCGFMELASLPQGFMVLASLPQGFMEVVCLPQSLTELVSLPQGFVELLACHKVLWS